MHPLLRDTSIPRSRNLFFSRQPLTEEQLQMIQYFETPESAKRYKTSTFLKTCRHYVSALILGLLELCEIQPDDLENALVFQWYLAKDACRSLFRKKSGTAKTK